MVFPWLESILESPSFIFVLLILAFTPPILFMAWIRNTEKFQREPWGQVVRTFIWGAIFAVLIAVFLTSILFAIFDRIDPVYVFLGEHGFSDPQVVLLALIIAPFTEEFAKALGVYSARVKIDEVEDGLVYGAVSGLGFSASENVVYGLAALFESGPVVSLALIAVRSVSSTFLHASATSATGYGIGKHRVLGKGYHVLPFYLLAVTMHSAFNFLASFGEFYKSTYGDYGYLFGFVAAVFFAIAAISTVRSKIIHAEREKPFRYQHRARP